MMQSSSIKKLDSHYLKNKAQSLPMYSICKNIFWFLVYFQDPSQVIQN